MPNANILCCLDESPIFSYNPLEGPNNVYVIMNYVSHKNKKWILKEKYLTVDVTIFYFEIQMDLALEKMNPKNKPPKSKLERFCLNLLGYIMKRCMSEKTDASP